MGSGPGRDATLLGQLYEGAASADAWSAALRALAQRFDARAAGVSWPVVPGERAGSPPSQTWVGLEPAFERAHLEAYHPHDPWLRGFLARAQAPGARALLSEDLVAPDELVAGVYFNELCRPYELRGWMGAPLEYTPGVSLVSVGLLRDAGAGAFSERDRAALDALVPHLRAAVRLRERCATLEREASLQRSLLDRWSVPALAVRADGLVLCANEAGRRALEAGPVTLRRGHLAASDERDERALLAAVRAACDPTAPRSTEAAARAPLAVALGARSGAPSRALVCPAHEPVDPGPRAARGDAALVFLFDQNGDAASEANRDALLRAVYRLSPAEARLARLLASGAAPRDAAAQLGITLNTARTHLKRVFRKLDVHRQSELVRALGGLSQVRPAAR